jgi:hypothetical protein
VTGDVNFTGSLRKNGILYQPNADLVINSFASISTSNAAAASNLTVAYNLAVAASNKAFTTSGGSSQWGSSGSVVFLGSGSNVGVGTSSPSTTLHLSSATAGTTVESTQAGSSASVVLKTASGQHTISRDTNGRMQFLNNTSTAVMTLSNANVGIGNATPSYSLDVTGDINFTGSLRQNGVVFSGGSGGSSVINSFSSISTSNAPTSSNLTVTYNLAVSASNAAFTGSNYAFTLLDTSLASTNAAKAGTASNLTVAYNLAVSASNRAFGLVGSQWSATDSNIYIGDSSNVGIGTSTPSYKLHVEGGDIYTSGDVIAASDCNYKTDITKIQNGLEKVMAISGYTFKKIDNDDKYHAGVLAQEIEQVLPEVVSHDSTGKKAVCYGNMVALLIEAIKDLKHMIDSK